MMKTLIVIPARYASERLEGKPLLDIHGKPMIQWVWENACQVGAEQVVVATDDERILAAAKNFGAHAEMTDATLRSGTDRAAVIFKKYPAEVVVNLQGDEPCLRSASIRSAIAFVRDEGFSIATLATPLRSDEERADPAVVKVRFDEQGKALEFARRDLGTEAWHHIGLYAYRGEALEKFCALPPSPGEKEHRLEQLRAMENGLSIGVVKVDGPIKGVDTPADLEKVRQILR